MNNIENNSIEKEKALSFDKGFRYGLLTGIGVFLICILLITIIYYFY
jgi:hypothetical protein